jgi:antitoxin (DNA-binding transcriptional repressor) of toxin-antitoxin stability system
MSGSIVMSSATIEVHELPERFAEILAIAAAGGEVIVTEGAVPRARLVALTAAPMRRAGLHPGAIATAANFDEQLPEEFWIGVS